MPYIDQLTDLREARTKYYFSGAGKSWWSDPDHSHLKSMMAANPQDRYYTVLVTGLETKNVVKSLFIDIESLAEIASWDLWRSQEDVRILKEQNERLSPLSCSADYTQPLMTERSNKPFAENLSFLVVSFLSECLDLQTSERCIGVDFFREHGAKPGDVGDRNCQKLFDEHDGLLLALDLCWEDLGPLCDFLLLRVSDATSSLLCSAGHCT